MPTPCGPAQGCCLTAERVPQLLTATIVDPREPLARGEAKGCRRKELERPRLLCEVTFERMIHVGNTGPDRVEGFERAHERASRKYLDIDAAAGRRADRLRETNCAGVRTRRGFRPVG